MKQRYNLITIKLKIAKTEVTNELNEYKMLIKLFRGLEDLGVIKVDYFEDKEIEKEIK